MTKSPANIATNSAASIAANAATPSDVHIGRLRIATDRPMSVRQAQALGDAFANQLGAALDQAARPTRLHIAELVVDASQHQLSDHHAVAALANSLARRVLDRTPE